MYYKLIFLFKMSDREHLKDFPSFYDVYEENSLQSSKDFGEELFLDSCFSESDEKDIKENGLQEGLDNLQTQRKNEQSKSTEIQKENFQKEEQKENKENNGLNNGQTNNKFELKNKPIQPNQFNYISNNANSNKVIDEDLLSKKTFRIEENKKKEHKKINNKKMEKSSSHLYPNTMELEEENLENNPSEKKKNKYANTKDNFNEVQKIKKIYFSTNKKEIQTNGRPSKKKIYFGSKDHDMEEMINSVNKINSECNNQIHSFFWKFIKSEIKEENIKIILKKGKKYDTFGIKITKSNEDKEPLSINIEPPSITKLISGKKKEEPFDPNNKYHSIKGHANRCKEIMNEKIKTLYKEYSLPKRAEENEETKEIKNEFERRKKREEEYKPKIKESLGIILKTEDNKEKKPIRYLANKKFGDFMKFFMNYDDNSREIEKEICKNIYGDGRTKLEGFKVYNECKNKFSNDINKQKEYRTYIITKMLENEL